MDLEEGWNHVVRVERVVKATTTPSQNQNPSPQPVTDVPQQPKVTSTRKRASPSLLQPLSWLLGRPRRKQPRVSKPRPLNTISYLGVPTQSSTSPLEEISDLDRLPLQACVEVTLRLFTSISLPTGVPRPTAVLKTVILFVAEYGGTP